MGSFKKGDKVICINPGKLAKFITLGNVYIVQSCTYELVEIIDDGLVSHEYFTYRFIPFNQTLYWLYK
jgi:hypothetical protein